MGFDIDSDYDRALYDGEIAEERERRNERLERKADDEWSDCVDEVVNNERD